ncbi:MAG: hypothetical protein ABL973_19205 [Micropepsaceae bacterium]
MPDGRHDTTPPAGPAAAALLPGLDLTALAQSSIAASIFFAWNIADYLSDPYPHDSSAVSIAVDQAQLVAYLLTMSFGYVFIALGIAHFLQRQQKRLRPFAFMTTSLGAVVPLVAINAAMQWLDLIEIGRAPEDYAWLWWQQLTRLALSNAATLIVVAFASRLYLHRRALPPDPRDGARFVALATAATLAAVLFVAWWMFRNWHEMIGGPVPPGAVIVSVLSHMATRIVWSVGVVFMYGYAAIAVVRRLGTEDRLLGITLAAVLAAIVHWLVVYGSYVPMLFAVPHWQWDQPIWRALLTSVAIGTAAGPIYLYVVDRDAFRRAVEALPALVDKVRRWPED